jgi:hypothetical protein
MSALMVDVHPLESNDRELLRVSGLRENKISNLLCLQLILPGAMDLMTRGPTDGWSRFTSGLRHFRILMLRDFMLRDFEHFGTLRTSDFGLWAFRTLGGTVTKINDSLLILRSMVHDCFESSGFGSSEVLCTSHFETLEAHFPERLDQLPPVPL